LGTLPTQYNPILILILWGPYQPNTIQSSNLVFCIVSLMPFAKLIKNRAYFKRYQVKYRRRREGKTDYRQRKYLTIQDKNKYNTPKFRLVVRFTNKDVIVQVVYAKAVGDVVLCAAYSHELPRYGIKLGLTNYAAAYATGLLCARRLLTNLKLADKFHGVATVTGEYVLTERESEDAPRPFRVLLDVGLARTSTGARIFGAMKGASDGGLHVPHKERRFVGFDSETEQFDPAILRKYIFGVHVAEHMKVLASKPDQGQYHKQFSRYIKVGIEPDKIEEMYAKAHAAIRKDPALVHTKKPEKPVHKKYNKPKSTYLERKERVKQKLLALASQVDH